MTSRARRGKKLEGEFSQAARHIGESCFAWNSNGSLPCCDFHLCVQGLSVLVECKECREGRFYLGNLTERERDFLEKHDRAGGLSLLAIQHVLPNRSRLFVIAWEHVVTWEAQGFRAILLVDGSRPPGMEEVSRVRRPDSLGSTWDLWPFLSLACLQELDWNLKVLREASGHSFPQGPAEVQACAARVIDYIRSSTPEQFRADLIKANPWLLEHPKDG